MLQKEFITYIEDIMDRIEATPETKKRIRQSLTEHIEVLVEKHGSLAEKHLAPVEQVAREFMENLESEDRVEPRVIYRTMLPHMKKVSKRKIFNMPLYYITTGYNPETGKLEVARGFIAIGPVAIGVFALGGVSLGVFGLGGVTLGLLLALGGLGVSLGAALGGVAIGGLFAMGGFALSFGIAFGGLAVGHVAIGGEPFGTYYYNMETGAGNAAEWFRRYLPFLAKHFF